MTDYLEVCVFKRIILGLAMGVVIFGVAMLPTVRAQAVPYPVPYQVLKYGTNELSYASAYFITPGDVTAVGDQYRVSLVIATTHDLGHFPVTILTVNNQKPTVNQTTQGDKDYYSFSFTIIDPKALLSGTMKVDVDSLNYHHTYDFNLKLDAQNVPALGQNNGPAVKSSQKTVAVPQSGTTDNYSQPAHADAGSVTTVRPAAEQSTSASTQAAGKRLEQSSVSSQVLKDTRTTHIKTRDQSQKDWSIVGYSLAGILLGGVIIASHLLWSKIRQKGV